MFLTYGKLEMKLVYKLIYSVQIFLNGISNMCADSCHVSNDSNGSLIFKRKFERITQLSASLSKDAQLSKNSFKIKSHQARGVLLD